MVPGACEGTVCWGLCLCQCSIWLVMKRSSSAAELPGPDAAKRLASPLADAFRRQGGRGEDAARLIELRMEVAPAAALPK